MHFLNLNGILKKQFYKEEIMTFKKHIFINSPLIISILFIFYHFYLGNFQFGIWWEYTSPTKLSLLLMLIFLFIQLFIWIKFRYPIKYNCIGWLAVFIMSFYFGLETNLLSFIKTPITYYSSLLLMVTTIPLLILQIIIWLFLFVRNFWFR